MGDTDSNKKASFTCLSTPDVASVHRWLSTPDGYPHRMLHQCTDGLPGTHKAQPKMCRFQFAQAAITAHGPGLYNWHSGCLSGSSGKAVAMLKPPTWQRRQQGRQFLHDSLSWRLHMPAVREPGGPDGHRHSKPFASLFQGHSHAGGEELVFNRILSHKPVEEAYKPLTDNRKKSFNSASQQLTCDGCPTQRPTKGPRTPTYTKGHKQPHSHNSTAPHTPGLFATRNSFEGRAPYCFERLPKGPHIWVQTRFNARWQRIMSGWPRPCSL
eukprot:366433-Chlamydomonas_euryale.AAC.29